MTPMPILPGGTSANAIRNLRYQQWLFARPVDHAVDAGDAALSPSTLPQPTVTHIAAPTVQLVLSDSDDTGLEVVAKALLVASAPGTVGNDPYADSDRGGTDTPLDGELGLGATDTVISRFRRLTAGELTLNDNDNPSALDIGSYFDAGGAGNDLTIYLQTLDAGEVSFAAASQFVLGGGGFARFTLPADAQTLLNGIASGDRFIFKAARPATVATDHAVDAGDAAFSFSMSAADCNPHFAGWNGRSRG